MAEADSTVYGVFSCGVFSRGYNGVYSTLDLARAAAHELIRQEDDDYHYYEIVPFVIDVKIFEDPRAVYRLSRKDDEVLEVLSG